MPHPYFSHGAFIIATIPAIFGVNIALRPQAALQSIDWPVAKDIESRRLSNSTLRLLAVRNVAVSYLLVLIWSQGNQRLTGLSLGATVWMSLADGVVSRMFTGGGEWNHWSLTPVIAGVAAGLLGWLS